LRIEPARNDLEHAFGFGDCRRRWRFARHLKMTNDPPSLCYGAASE
jgi:hypothetical protein